MHVKRFLLIAFAIFVFAFTLHAQNPNNSTNIGQPDNASFHGSDIDNLQLNNGNLHIEIPLYSLGGRGPSATFKYVYDSKGWYAYTSNPVLGSPVYIEPLGYNDNGTGAQPFYNMQWNIIGPMSNPVAGNLFPGLGVSTLKTSCVIN